MNTRTVRTVNKRPESSKKKEPPVPRRSASSDSPFSWQIQSAAGYSFITISTPSSSQFTGVIPSNLTSSRFEK